MQALIERCCGLDVHQETVVACLLIGAAGAWARKEVRTFRTVRRELETLRDWLKAAGATHVGMESTGVYGVTTRSVKNRALSGASGKWDATSLGLERYTGYRSGLGRLR